MKKLTVLMAMAFMVAMLNAPVYAAGTDSDVITVNVAVEPWIEIALIDPNPLNLEVDNSDKAHDTVEITVKCNSSWSLIANPEWGNYFGIVAFQGGNWTAPGRQPFAGIQSTTKTAVDGEIVTVDIEVHAVNQNGEFLSPDDDGTINIQLMASAGS